MRAFIAGEPVRIRKPKAVRPWQHVLDPVLGYLTLAQCLAANRHDFAEGWNFGPNSNSAVPVSELVCKLAEKWSPSAKWEIDSSDHHQHEADYLGLDSSKAQSRLGWRPLIDLDRALQLSVDWYRAQVSGEVMRDVTYRQIESVLQTALQPAPIP
jgi:CDP-glucose 4,6-dehydratase